jgi:hypothetical protein
MFVWRSLPTARALPTPVALPMVRPHSFGRLLLQSTESLFFNPLRLVSTRLSSRRSLKFLRFSKLPRVPGLSARSSLKLSAVQLQWIELLSQSGLKWLLVSPAIEVTGAVRFQLVPTGAVSKSVKVNLCHLHLLHAQVSSSQTVLSTSATKTSNNRNFCFGLALILFINLVLNFLICLS